MPVVSKMTTMRDMILKEQDREVPAAEDVISHHTQSKGKETCGDQQLDRPPLKVRTRLLLEGAVQRLAPFCGRARAITRIAAASGLARGQIVSYLKYGVPEHRRDAVFGRGVEHVDRQVTRQVCGAPPEWLGTAVRRLRRACGWSREDLARELDVDVGTVRDAEERRCKFRRETQKRLDWLWVLHTFVTEEEPCSSARA